MDPLSIALICAASFGTVMVIAAFIRQALLSRDKKLNDEAQRRALAQEALEMKKIRTQMQSNKRFEAHHQYLGDNKGAIVGLDNRIEEILHKKAELIDRYAKISFDEAGAIVDCGASVARKEDCDRLRIGIDQQLKAYDSEMQQLQTRRSALWDAEDKLLDHLLAEEKSRNASLDNLYKQHSRILEKIYLRHIANTEAVTVSGIEASTVTFKDMIAAPIQFLAQFFGRSAGIALVQTTIEQRERLKVQHVEGQLNDSQSDEELDISPSRQQLNKISDEESSEEIREDSFAFPSA